jgi:hypothetical protein
MLTHQAVNSGDGEWEWVSIALRVASVTSQPDFWSFAVAFDSKHTVQAYNPVFLHIPNSAGWSDGEAANYLQILNGYNGPNCAPGQMCDALGPLLHQAVNVIPYSTTPAINLKLGAVQQFACTSANAKITPTISGLMKGLEFTVIFVQNGTGACTWVWPSTVHGGTTVSSTLSSISTQKFVVSNNGTDAYAIAAGSSATGGTP